LFGKPFGLALCFAGSGGSLAFGLLGGNAFGSGAFVRQTLSFGLELCVALGGGRSLAFGLLDGRTFGSGLLGGQAFTFGKKFGLTLGLARGGRRTLPFSLLGGSPCGCGLLVRPSLLFGQSFGLVLRLASGSHTLALGLLGGSTLGSNLLGGRTFGQQRVAFGLRQPFTLGLVDLGALGRQALRLAFCLGPPRVGATPPDPPARQQAQHGCSQQPGHEFVHE